jgi:hypothetical protein
VVTLARALALGTLCAWLAGCNSTTVDSYRTMKLAIAGPPPVATVGYVRSLDRPALAARLGNAEAVMVLAARRNGVDEWHGVTETLVLRHGRLVQSAGLPDGSDLIVATPADDPFQGDLRTLQDGTEVTRLVDLPARFLTGIPQYARYSLGPLQTREIMGVKRELRRVDERISMPALGFRATNRYWFDPASGRVLISEQQWLPGMPGLILTELVSDVNSGEQP